MNLLERNRRFFDTWARFYDHGPISWWLRAVQRQAILIANPHWGERILDASCGTGHALKQMTCSGAKLAGIDLSPNMLERAQKNLAGLDVMLLNSDVEELPFSDASFDCVMTMEAFHHYPDQEQALRELFRVLRPEGRLLLVDINLFFEPAHRLFEMLEPGCVRINTKEQMRMLIKDAGFLVLEQRRIGIFAVATYARRPGP